MCVCPLLVMYVLDHVCVQKVLCIAQRADRQQDKHQALLLSTRYGQYNNYQQHPFNVLLSGTTRVSQYQKAKTNKFDNQQSNCLTL